MKLHEITDDEPLLLVLMRQRMDKGQRIAWYVRSGDKSKPVWVHDWHQMMKVYEDGPQPVWTIKGYQNFNVQYKHIRQDNIDQYTLIPGKTKNTWQLTYAARVDSENTLVPGKTRNTWKLSKPPADQVQEGVGSYLMDYMDFAEKNFTGKLRSSYDKLANDLLKRGYSFSTSPAGNAGTFKNPTSGYAESIQVRMIGKVKKPGGTRNPVMVSITGHDPGTGELRGKHQTFDIADMTDDGADIDFILSGRDH